MTARPSPPAQRKIAAALAVLLLALLAWVFDLWELLGPALEE